MKLSFAKDRVLAVMAHPDDAELLCAGTLARAAMDGAAVGICVLCRGDKGIASTQMSGDLTEIRRAEMEAAAKLLGAALFNGGFSDGELVDGPEERKTLIEVYRHFEPTLVLAHSTNDYHPDHRAAAQIAEAATWFCASRGHVTQSRALACPPVLWWCDTLGMHHFEPSIFIEITEQHQLKKRMLDCHQSQLARGKDRDFAQLAEQMNLQVATRGAQSGVSAAEAFRPHLALKRTMAW